MFSRNIDDQIKSQIIENIEQVFQDKLKEDDFKIRQKRLNTFVKGHLMASAALEGLGLPTNT